MMAALAWGVLTAFLLSACATPRNPEHVRIEGLAQECLQARDRNTIQTVRVDSFGRVLVDGRQTDIWNQEMEALGDCLEAKGVRFSGPRRRAPVLK